MIDTFLGWVVVGGKEGGREGGNGEGRERGERWKEDRREMTNCALSLLQRYQAQSLERN